DGGQPTGQEVVAAVTGPDLNQLTLTAEVGDILSQDQFPVAALALEHVVMLLQRHDCPREIVSPRHRGSKWNVVWSLLLSHRITRATFVLKVARTRRGRRRLPIRVVRGRSCRAGGGFR